MRRTTALLLTWLAACATSGGAPVAPAAPPAWPDPPPAYRPADGWWREAVFYEVFVRSFKDSDGDGDGDLRGLIQRLDYLNDGDPATTTDLGVDALWLMPVFASPSYHGYDTTDYEALEPGYGRPDDFRDLIVEAHRRGIKVVVDLVLNHTSVQHPWFREATAPGARGATGTFGAPSIPAGRSPGTRRRAPGTRPTAPSTTGCSGAGCPT